MYDMPWNLDYPDPFFGHRLDAGISDKWIK